MMVGREVADRWHIRLGPCLVVRAQSTTTAQVAHTQIATMVANTQLATDPTIAPGMAVDATLPKTIGGGVALIKGVERRSQKDCRNVVERSSGLKILRGRAE